MSRLYLMMTVAARARLPEIVPLLRKHGAAFSLISLGSGTASRSTLDYLGLSGRERAVLFSFVTDESWRPIKNDLLQRLYFGAPGTGIAGIIPLSSVGGRRELSYLLQEQPFTKEEESSLKNTDNELLIVISNQGYNELVMDAARAAGAPGGTVLHAQGTGTETAEKFLGITLAAEKDVTLIVSSAGRKKELMRAIMEKAGLSTPAGSIVFSLPVTDTAGLRMPEDGELKQGRMREEVSPTPEETSPTEK